MAEHVLEAGLKAEDDTVRLAVHLLYFTGQRISDVCAMTWRA
jgi:integrase